MPTAHTRLSIYNAALDLTKSIAVQSSGADAPEVRWLNRNYEQYVDVALMTNLWSFAIEDHALEADAGYTARRGWSYRYAWPNGALRFIAPSANGYSGAASVPYKIAGDYIYTNTAPTLDCDFVMRKLEPGTWHPLFAQLVIASLAEGMAQRFSSKSSYLQLAMQKKTEALTKAEEVDAIMAGVETSDDSAIIAVRS